MTWSQGEGGPGGREVLCPGPGGGGGSIVTWSPTNPPPPPPEVGQTNACENITFARFATRAVKTTKFFVGNFRNSWTNHQEM